MVNWLINVSFSAVSWISLGKTSIFVGLCDKVMSKGARVSGFAAFFKVFIIGEGSLESGFSKMGEGIREFCRFSKEIREFSAEFPECFLEEFVL